MNSRFYPQGRMRLTQGPPGSGTDTLPTAGLVALYDFVKDEAFPQRLTDRSGNGRHGTLGSNATAQDTNDPAWTAQGLTFDGVDDYVNAPVPAGLSSGTALIVGRFTASPGRLLALGNGTVNNRITIWVSGANAVTVEYADGAGASTVLGYITEPGTWAAYTARWTPTSFRATKNAGEHLSGSLSSVALAPTSVTFGNANAIGLARPLAGSEAYGVLWGRDLTDGEVARAIRVIKKQLAQRGVTV